MNLGVRSCDCWKVACGPTRIGYQMRATKPSCEKYLAVVSQLGQRISGTKECAPTAEALVQMPLGVLFLGG